jgi:hypothetical protein
MRKNLLFSIFVASTCIMAACKNSSHTGNAGEEVTNNNSHGALLGQADDPGNNGFHSNSGGDNDPHNNLGSNGGEAILFDENQLVNLHNELDGLAGKKSRANFHSFFTDKIFNIWSQNDKFKEEESSIKALQTINKFSEKELGVSPSGSSTRLELDQLGEAITYLKDKTDKWTAEKQP